MQFLHTVHCVIFNNFTINFGIGTYFVYSHWYLKKMLPVLSLVLVLKQPFNELINGKNQTNTDQKLNLLFLQRYNFEQFNSGLLIISKKLYKDIDICYIGCNTN